jgi:hypothetical protein
MITVMDLTSTEFIFQLLKKALYHPDSELVTQIIMGYIMIRCCSNIGNLWPLKHVFPEHNMSFQTQLHVNVLSTKLGNAKGNRKQP